MLFKEHLGRVAKRAVAGMAAAGALAALASCGGGTYQEQVFVPARILTFGDESSRLEGAQGLKYSINAISPATQQIDCTLNPLWTQAVANSYGLIYRGCNVEATFETDAIDLTTVNGTTADVAKQVAAFQAGDTFNYNDLVTIWVGVHDVLNDYQANATGNDDLLLSDMRAQGAALAATVNTIANAGAKVLLLTIPDMSLSPYGYTEALRGDFDRAKLLSDMTVQFNTALRANIINDGSKIGLVSVDDLVHQAAFNPTAFGMIFFANQTPGCLDTAPLPTCTEETLRNDPTTGQPATASFMWADPTHLGNVMQTQIGNQAVSRTRSNPF